MADRFLHDLAVRIEQPTDPDAPLTFDLHTFDPDADDDGRAQDYGVSVIEGGTIVGDGSRDGYNVKKLLHLASLLEHAPDLLTIAEWLLEGKLIEATRKARTVVGEIEGRELKYRPEVKL